MQKLVLMSRMQTNLKMSSFPKVKQDRKQKWSNDAIVKSWWSDAYDACYVRIVSGFSACGYPEQIN